MNRINNKTSVFITGANGGLGLETVKLLVKANTGRIALATRTQKKADWTKAQFPDSVNSNLESYGGFDMNDAKAIKDAVDALPANKPFDVVFLQSGGMVVSNDFQFVKAAGMKIEKNIYQNVIGGYITLKSLQERNLLAPNARIIFAGGEGARGIKGMISKPVFTSQKELESYIYQGAENYSDIDALGTSKFMSALLVQELAEKDPNHEYIWFTPGLTAGTNGLKDVANPKRFIMEKIGFPMMQLLGFAQSPQKAAQKYFDALDGKYGKSGDLIGAPEGKALGKLVDQKPMNPGLTNRSFREAFVKIVKEVYQAENKRVNVEG